MNMPDARWFHHHLLVEILPRWLENAVTKEGAFLPRLDRAWRPRAEQVVTLVSQSRLIYNFAQGWWLAGDPAYRDAVLSGSQFLLEHLHDPVCGGWFWSCTPNGEVVDDRKDTYGHAFTLFGLAHATLVSGELQLREALLHTWDVIHTRLRDEMGGFHLRAQRDFSLPEETRSQNPVMHLFEALLAASDLACPESPLLFRSERVAPPAPWPAASVFLTEAARIAAFIESLVLPSLSLLPETYDARWQPLPTERGGRIDLGHAFEWAYLLSAGVERGLDQGLLELAKAFIEGGLRLGFDPADGGIRGNATLEGKPRQEGKGWWQQCEALRALLHFAYRHQRDDFLTPAKRVFAFIRTRFLDPEFGGWYAHVTPEGTPTHYDKGNEWKLDYHAAGMCVEAIRLLSEPGFGKGNPAHSNG